MKVAVIGTGLTKFGELWDDSFTDLFIEAGKSAIEDAGIAGEDIGALYVGNMSGGRFIEQEHIAPMIADHVGLTPMPAVRVEAACASGGLALRQGIMAIESGLHEVVVVGGIEKMTDISTERVTQTLITAADQEWEAGVGMTFPGLYAMMARKHMHDFGTTREQLAMVSVKNHANAKHNPHAHFQFEITLEQAMSSPLVADPLRLLDCSPISDGAACIVLASEKAAKKFKKKDDIVYITGSGHATSSIALHDRKNIAVVDASIIAAKRAYKMAKKGQRDIDVAEVHDAFTIGEILAAEALGFCEIGDGGKLTESGETARDGKMPINTSGGLKAKGHPVGATGVAQAIEITKQLLKKAGKRQVKKAGVGLTHNVGGSGGTAVVHIFEA